MKTPILTGIEGLCEIKYKKDGSIKSGGHEHLQTRIFRPSEVALMRKEMKIEEKTNFDMSLLLGARYTECKRIQVHPEWYDGNFIHISEHKVKRVTQQRFIRLSTRGKNTIEYFFNNDKHLPSVQAWDTKLKRWSALAGLGDVGVSARSLRKTLESWLVISYPENIALIFGSQGHTELTALRHYLNMPFTDDEKKEMQEWIGGWK